MKFRWENGLKSITITNKDELMALWLVGGSDRTLQYALNPTDAQVQTSDISVTSDNTGAVTVDGFTLKAVGARYCKNNDNSKGQNGYGNGACAYCSRFRFDNQ